MDKGRTAQVRPLGALNSSSSPQSTVNATSDDPCILAAPGMYVYLGG